ncbi:hypothetical protein BASA81_001085 [Batrachochytrium salamandrivorans]|nr:hypothetical protein BASA81_001085 [Batrachochytrium salamandrivorans]
MDWSSTLLVLNCVGLLACQLSIEQLEGLSVEFITTLQASVESWGAYNAHLVWLAAEGIGPDPKFATLLFILVFARSGEEASAWLVIRFLSTYVRWVLGMLLQEPRPSWISDRVDMLHCAQTFGLPAGHAVLMSSLAVSYCLSRRWYMVPVVLAWYLAMCMGRLFLGTHSMHDLVLGTLMGANIAALLFEKKQTMYEIRRFVYDQGVWFILMLVGFGVSSSVGLAHMLAQLANKPALQLYASRVLANGCPAIHPYHAADGCLALASLSGLLFQISIGNFRLVQQWSTRLTAIGIFAFPSVLTVLLGVGGWDPQSDEFWVGKGFPNHFLLGLAAICNFGGVAWMFTSPTREEEMLERRRLLATRVGDIQSQSMYGSLPPRRSNNLA